MRMYAAFFRFSAFVRREMDDGQMGCCNLSNPPTNRKIITRDDDCACRTHPTPLLHIYPSMQAPSRFPSKSGTAWPPQATAPSSPSTTPMMARPASSPSRESSLEDPLNCIQLCCHAALPCIRRFSKIRGPAECVIPCAALCPALHSPWLYCSQEPGQLRVPDPTAPRPALHTLLGRQHSQPGAPRHLQRGRRAGRLMWRPRLVSKGL